MYSEVGKTSLIEINFFLFLFLSSLAFGLKKYLQAAKIMHHNFNNRFFH